ncbi:hypothetical protein AVEN_88263-1 [Araneus ventricosus]|uniref:Uncharacterized protein n=1 Tax=Araneus ventricosus TaxID=182803 RepID=A0A4Y2EPX2_ARAVE|nr:hypothetical protein AVEN_88263-1 [Araneus ventricosus]
MKNCLPSYVNIMNNRPITFISDDAEDLTPLTPAMFLHEICEIGVSDFNQLDSFVLNGRLVYLQKLKQTLQERFRLDSYNKITNTFKRISQSK